MFLTVALCVCMDGATQAPDQRAKDREFLQARAEARWRRERPSYAFAAHHGTVNEGSASRRATRSQLYHQTVGIHQLRRGEICRNFEVEHDSRDAARSRLPNLPYQMIADCEGLHSLTARNGRTHARKVKKKTRRAIEMIGNQLVVSMCFDRDTSDVAEGPETNGFNGGSEPSISRAWRYGPASVRQTAEHKILWRWHRIDQFSERPNTVASPNRRTARR